VIKNKKGKAPNKRFTKSSCLKQIKIFIKNVDAQAGFLEHQLESHSNDLECLIDALSQVRKQSMQNLHGLGSVQIALMGIHNEIKGNEKRRTCDEDVRKYR